MFRRQAVLKLQRSVATLVQVRPVTYDCRWRRYCGAFLLDSPVCVRCHNLADHVDHIEPVYGLDDPGFWDPTNHQALCASCHSRKTAGEDRFKGTARRR